MFFRKRYNSYGAVALTYIALVVASTESYLMAAFFFAVGWICFTQPDSDPNNRISVWDIVKELLKLAPLQIFVVSLIWVLGFVMYPIHWMLYPLVVLWFLGSFIYPVLATKNVDWYIDNHLFTSAGYFAMCAACWWFVGPLAIDLVSALFNL